MKKRSLLKVIPILLFSPLIIESLASCGNIHREEKGVAINSNVTEVAFGSYELNVYDAEGILITDNIFKINHTLKIENIKPDEGYILDSITALVGEKSFDITSDKKYKIISDEEILVYVHFKKNSDLDPIPTPTPDPDDNKDPQDPTPTPEEKASTILIDEAITNGVIAFKNHKSGEEVKNNTLVEVIVSPNDGFILDTLKVNNIDITDKKQFVTNDEVKAYIVTATFKEHKEEEIKKSLIVIDSGIENGTVSFVEYKSGDSVLDKTAVEVNVSPAANYMLDTLTVNDIDIKNEKKFITSETVTLYLVKATFKAIPLPEIKKSELQIDNNIQNGIVEFIGHEVGEKVVDKTEISLKVTPNDQFELETLTVNGLDIFDDLGFITDENVDTYLVSATFKKIEEQPIPPTPEVEYYGIDFVNFTSSEQITNFKGKYVDTNNIVSSITGSKTSTDPNKGVKIASSKNDGSLTFKLNNELLVTKIVVKTNVYDSGSNIKLKLSNGKTTESKPVVDHGEVTFDINSVSTNSIEILAKKDKRFYVQGIKIYTGTTNPEPEILKSKIRYEDPLNGQISFEGLENNSEVNVGTIVKVNVKADEGYELDTLKVNGKDIKAAASFAANEANVTYVVTAAFKKIPEVKPDTPEDLFTKYNCITIDEAIRISKETGTTLTKDEYYVTGTIININNKQYGNLTIADEKQSSLFVYGASNWSLLESKPQVGDEIVYKGKLQNFKNSTPELFNPEIVEIVTHTTPTPTPDPDPQPEVPQSASISVTTQNMDEGLFAKAINADGELKSGDVVTVSYSESETCIVKQIRINGRNYYGEINNREFKVTLIPGVNTVVLIYGQKGENTPSTDVSHYFESTIVQNMGDRGNQGTVDSYYESCRGLSGQALKEELARICQPTERYSYKHNSTSFPLTDVDPDDPTKIVLTYTGERRPIDNYGVTVNREHTWPNSRGAGTSGPGADKHMIRPTESQINSLRSNYDFDYVTHTSKNHCATQRAENEGNYRDTSAKLFEPKDEYKGDTARMVFYLAITYPQMEVALPEHNAYLFNTWTSSYSLGSFDAMYEWATNTTIDPVSKIEMNRNNVIDITYQHNRNPFIDHPEFVEMIYSKEYNGPGALIK